MCTSYKLAPAKKNILLVLYKPPPLTYSALADFRPKGECGDGKGEEKLKD